MNSENKIVSNENQIMVLNIRPQMDFRLLDAKKIILKMVKIKEVQNVTNWIWWNLEIYLCFYINVYKPLHFLSIPF